MGSVKESIKIPGKGHLIIAGDSAFSIKDALTGKEQPRGTMPDETNKGSFDYAPAGNNDKFFEELLDDAKKSTIINPGITFKAEMLYGNGIEWVRKTSSNGIASEEVVSSGDPFEFNRKSNFPLHYMMAAKDLVGLGTGYYQISLNEKGDKIMAVTAHNSRCRSTRLGWRDTNGVIKNAYINADFGRSTYKKERTKTLPLINTIYDPADWLREEIARGSKQRHFIYPVQFVSLSAENYYPLPDWNTARVSDWLEVSEKIAKLKKNMIDKSMNLKLHFEFHPSYWKIRFGETQWKEWSEEEQLKQMEEEATRLDKFFKGVEGGNVFLSNKLKAAVGQDAESSVTIHEFKQNVTDGILNEDSTEATNHILFAIGLHPSTFGSGSSKGLGNSGSEGKVSYNQRKHNMAFYQQQLVNVLYTVRDYNNYGEDLHPRVKNNPDIVNDSALPPEQRTLQTQD